MLSLITLSLFACKDPIVAPTELNELSRYLFVNWDSDDAEVIQAGLANLEDWAAGDDPDSPDMDSNDWSDRGFEIEPLLADDVAALINHSNDPVDAGAVGVVYQSTHASSEHATLFIMEDQTPIEPASPDKYDRTFTQGDPDAWASGDDEYLYSSNAVHRKNILVDFEYTMLKAWRWVQTEDGRDVAIARAWCADEGPISDGDEQMIQLYSTEVWMDNGDGALRWLVTWQEAELGLDEDIVISALGSGMDDAFKAHDEYLEDN